jgi:aromatic ring-opening dioxygenase catalytic subunit (LigB family)
MALSIHAAKGKSMRMPTFYIPHGGGPCFFMDWPAAMGGPDTWKNMAAWLGQLPELVGARPEAIVVISGHWEEGEFTVNSGAHPELLFDYYGFPEHTYRLEYPAPGAPALAREICSLLEGAGIRAGKNSERGFDHGVFIPFKVIYPQADIPIVQLSLKEGLDPAEHIAAGRAIAPLRERGVLIVGSGMSYHNLREMGRDVRAVSDQWDAWLTRAVSAPSEAARAEALARWEEAPGARRAHPREEHLIPLMVAAGAGGEDIGKKVLSDHVLGTTVSAFQFGGSRGR